MSIILPTPTNRFVMEPSLICNIKCKFCYHLHRYDTWKDTVKSWETVKAEIDAGISRGNTYMDITGGEPTIYPHINQMVEYALSKNVRTSIITNGIVSKDKFYSLVQSGIDGFLVSRHGLEDTHNLITNRKDAYAKQIEFLNKIIYWNNLKDDTEDYPEDDPMNHEIQLRFNTVISKFNQTELLEIAKEMAEYNPEIVNFINMNPHHEWMDKALETKEVIADLRVVEPILNEAIAYLESKGIGVNVRYYPMCRIAEEYRRCIANDLHVTVDPYEWDYQIPDKDYAKFRQWGIDCSMDNEEKNEPCCDCDLAGVCGGANKHFHKASTECQGEVLIPQTGTGVTANDFYHYRKHNILTLKER